MEQYEASLEPNNIRLSRFIYPLVADAKKLTTVTRATLDRLLEGAVDMHIHAGPDARSLRMCDQIDVGLKACDAGMRAVVFKQAWAPSACQAPLVQKVLNQWATEHNRTATDVFGGVVLNYPVGGLNPRAVSAAAGYGGKFVWLPTMDASHHRRVMGQDGGINVLDEKGHVVRDLLEIFKIVAEHDLILVLAHQSAGERLEILKEARKLGVRRILADHVQWPLNKLTIDQMRHFAGEGVYLGLYWAAAAPNVFNPEVDPSEVVKIINEVDTEYLVGGTDLMQLGNPDPVIGLRLFMEMLLLLNVPEELVRKIFTSNPIRFIYG